MLRTPERNSLQRWLQLSPSHSRIPWRKIPACHPELGLEGVGERAMKTVFRQLGYVHRVSKRKGYSADHINSSAMSSLKKELDGRANKSIIRYSLTRFGRMGEHIPHRTSQSKNMDLIVT